MPEENKALKEVPKKSSDNTNTNTTQGDITGAKGALRTIVQDVEQERRKKEEQSKEKKRVSFSLKEDELTLSQIDQYIASNPDIFPAELSDENNEEGSSKYAEHDQVLLKKESRDSVVSSTKESELSIDRTGEYITSDQERFPPEFYEKAESYAKDFVKRFSGNVGGIDTLAKFAGEEKKKWEMIQKWAEGVKPSSSGHSPSESLPSSPGSPPIVRIEEATAALPINTEGKRESNSPESNRSSPTKNEFLAPGSYSPPSDKSPLLPAHRRRSSGMSFLSFFSTENNHYYLTASSDGQSEGRVSPVSEQSSFSPFSLFRNYGPNPSRTEITTCLDLLERVMSCSAEEQTAWLNTFKPSAEVQSLPRDSGFVSASNTQKLEELSNVTQAIHKLNLLKLEERTISNNPKISEDLRQEQQQSMLQESKNSSVSTRNYKKVHRDINNTIKSEIDNERNIYEEQAMIVRESHISPDRMNELLDPQKAQIEKKRYLTTEAKTNLTDLEQKRIDVFQRLASLRQGLSKYETFQSVAGTEAEQRSDRIETQTLFAQMLQEIAKDAEDLASRAKQALSEFKEPQTGQVKLFFECYPERVQDLIKKFADCYHKQVVNAYWAAESWGDVIRASMGQDNESNNHEIQEHDDNKASFEGYRSDEKAMIAIQREIQIAEYYQQKWNRMNELGQELGSRNLKEIPECFGEVQSLIEADQAELVQIAITKEEAELVQIATTKEMALLADQEAKEADWLASRARLKADEAQDRLTFLGKYLKKFNRTSDKTRQRLSLILTGKIKQKMKEAKKLTDHYYKLKESILDQYDDRKRLYFRDSSPPPEEKPKELLEDTYQPSKDITDQLFAGIEAEDKLYKDSEQQQETLTDTQSVSSSQETGDPGKRRHPLNVRLTFDSDGLTTFHPSQRGYERGVRTQKWDLSASQLNQNEKEPSRQSKENTQGTSDNSLPPGMTRFILEVERILDIEAGAQNTQDDSVAHITLADLEKAIATFDQSSLSQHDSLPEGFTHITKELYHHILEIDKLFREQNSTLPDDAQDHVYIPYDIVYDQQLELAKAESRQTRLKEIEHQEDKLQFGSDQQLEVSEWKSKINQRIKAYQDKIGKIENIEQDERDFLTIPDQGLSGLKALEDLKSAFINHPPDQDLQEAAEGVLDKLDRFAAEVKTNIENGGSFSDESVIANLQSYLNDIKIATNSLNETLQAAIGNKGKDKA